MKIIVYTLPYKIGGESKLINELFYNGLEELHIRKPLYNISELRILINEIHVTHHSKIVIHNHFSLVDEFNLKGIHIEYNYFNNIFGKLLYKLKYKHRNYKIVSSFNPLKNNCLDTSCFDEISIGPIYNKVSENNYSQQINSFILKGLTTKLNIPFNFVGGINSSNFESLGRLNPKGMILQSGIWKSPNTLNAFNSFAILKNSIANTKEKPLQSKTAL